MKKTTLPLLAGILTSIICCYLGWLSLQPLASSDPTVSKRSTGPAGEIGVSRSSIAFILGDDKESDNRYYDEAFRYYTTHADEKTDFVIRSCRSLLEVKDYLQNHKSSKGPAWGTVHLVSHGNQWTGLSVKVTPDSKRATARRITEYTQSHLFESLGQTVVDAQTKIFLHGCGIGNNRGLIDAVNAFFGGKATVFAPKLFEYYASTGVENNWQSQRYMAQTWFVSYPMGDRPSSRSLSNELREKYPEARVDWQRALLREQPGWIGDVYHYTFEVPVKWIIPADSVTDLSEESQQIGWLYSQQQIVDELSGLQLPIEKFKWSLSSGYTETKAGLKTPAVFVKGYCTMLCILQVLTEGHNDRLMLQKPFAPEITDTRFYCSSPQIRLAGI
jgi:hypothetical protein